MKKLRFVALVLALLTGPLAAASIQGVKPEEVGFSSERLARIQQVVRRHIDAHDIAGAVTLVARRGRIAQFEAYGLADLDSGKRMSKDSLFWIASMSKPITGVAILMLLEEGKVRLTDPVSKFIPEFHLPQGNEIRRWVHQLAVGDVGFDSHWPVELASRT